MHVFMTGSRGGIGSALSEMLRNDGHVVLRVEADAANGRTWPGGSDKADAVICCAGTSDPKLALEVNLRWTIAMFHENLKAEYFIAFAGGGIGGPPTTALSAEYVASKAGIVSFVERFALQHPDKQAFAVSPGLTDTKINVAVERGAHPRVPALFIAKLLSGKYAHLSGSLLAAQRDDLDTMLPMRLRRVTT